MVNGQTQAVDSAFIKAHAAIGSLEERKLAGLTPMPAPPGKRASLLR